jgi:hypothetical protein
MEEAMTEIRSSLSSASGEAFVLPFDAARLDGPLDEAGIDGLVISSKHNIQYLFGGYRFFFFDHFDAIGVSRYLRQRQPRPDDLYWAPNGVLREGPREVLDATFQTGAQPSTPRSLQPTISEGSARS